MTHRSGTHDGITRRVFLKWGTLGGAALAVGVTRESEDDPS